MLAVLNLSMIEVTRVSCNAIFDWQSFVMAIEGVTLKEWGRPNTEARLPAELLVAQ